MGETMALGRWVPFGAAVMDHWVGNLLKWIFENPQTWPVGRRPVLGEPRIIAEALTKLLDRKDNSAYMIIEGCGFRRFVQFAVGKQGQLILDLPSTQMNELERVRAKDFFAKLGVAPNPKFRRYDLYQLDLGQDCNRGAELTCRIFTDLFAAPQGFKIQVSAG